MLCDHFFLLGGGGTGQHPASNVGPVFADVETSQFILPMVRSSAEQLHATMYNFPLVADLAAVFHANVADHTFGDQPDAAQELEVPCCCLLLWEERFSLERIVV